MSVPKAIAEARREVREAAATVESIKARIAADEVERAPFKASLVRLNQRHSRRPMLVKQPSGIKASDLTTFAGGYYGGTGIGQDESERAYAKRLIEGNAKVTLAGGSEFSPKSIPAKARYPQPAAYLAIKRAERIKTRAAAAYVRAQDAYNAALESAFAAGTKVEVAEVARYVAAKAVLSRKADKNRSWSLTGDLHRAEYILERDRMHLDHAEKRTKDPCPCSRCAQARRDAEWKAQREALAKQRAKDEAAERQRIARLPSVIFECPNDCRPFDDSRQQSPVYREGKRRWVECSDCGNAWDIGTIVTYPAAPAPGQTTIAA